MEQLKETLERVHTFKMERIINELGIEL